MDTAASANVHTFLSTENHMDVAGAKVSMQMSSTIIRPTSMRLHMVRLFFSHTAHLLYLLRCLFAEDTGGFDNENYDFSFIIPANVIDNNLLRIRFTIDHNGLSIKHLGALNDLGVLWKKLKIEEK